MVIPIFLNLFVTNAFNKPEKKLVEAENYPLPCFGLISVVEAGGGGGIYTKSLYSQNVVMFF